ncbi:MAG: NAD-dependent epimerase/dehydratase family protein [Thermoprotei archaeon]
MRVLVTGAAGFVGSHVTEYLSSHGMEVITSDVVPGYDLKGDLTDSNWVFNTLGSIKFDAVVHLAAIADLKKTQDDPYSCFRVNDFATLNLLELSHRKGVHRFVYASSANVYGAPSTLPVSEDHPFYPRVPYDYSKVIGESLALSYWKTKKLPVAITRSWLLFGERDLPNRAVPRFIRACLRDEKISLFNAGRDTTAPSHALNYAKLVMELISNDACVGEAFNFGGERVVSIKQLAQLIRELTGSRSELIDLPPRSEAESDPQISYPSLAKLKSKLGYVHELSLEEGIMRVVEWIRKDG